MVRMLVACLAVVFLTAGALRAEDIKGTVKTVNDTKISVTVGDDTKSYDLSKDVKVLLAGKKNKTTESKLSSVEAGQEVTLTTDTQDDKTVVTKIEYTAKKKKKAKTT
jgi:hypothetical protein